MTAVGYLIDTHIMLWDLNDDPRLSDLHANILISEAPKYISVASIWEISIKVAAGKLKMQEDLLDVIANSNVDLLPIETSHALRTSKLPLHHRDPFDRMLIAQAQEEELTIISSDRIFRRYEVRLI